MATKLRPQPHETPNMAHPGSDPSMSEAERQHCRALLGSLAAGINYALGVGEETAIRQGVPSRIVYRCMFRATHHRTAMGAAHYLAITKATDAEAETAARELADQLAELIIKQLPNSRETVARIEARDC